MVSPLQPAAVPERKRVTALYRYFDELGQILYVGVTANQTSRAARHRSCSAWWRFVDETRTTIEHFEFRSEAEAAETAAILGERPVFNQRKAASPSAATRRIVEYVLRRGRADLLTVDRRYGRVA